MENVYVICAAKAHGRGQIRTGHPVGRRVPDDLAAAAIKGAVDASGVDPADKIEDVVHGLRFRPKASKA